MTDCLSVTEYKQDIFIDRVWLLARRGKTVCFSWWMDLLKAKYFQGQKNQAD